ncbi:hypothetical protein [Pseudomonas sp. NPDC090201]|uniref:hypothetical protein n=1 Tax=Pseudomonas sp. NPDC090201 TaxID=3364475 RepID=UPI0038239A0B
MGEKNVTEEIVNQFTRGLGGKRFRDIFEILSDAGLRPLGKFNTGTLLFQFIDSATATHDVLAFRRSPDVLSFPISYWSERVQQRLRLCAPFSIQEKLSPLKGVGSTSNFSAGEVVITKESQERIKSLCRNVCIEIALVE